MKNQKIKYYIQNFISFVVMLLLVFITFYFLNNLTEWQIGLTEDYDFASYPSTLYFVITGILAALFHILIHETGHLIFGKLTGFHFVSFRIGPLMLQKSNGHLKLKIYSIKGTGGQCIMAPPKFPDDDPPFKLYNLGGGLFNLIISLVTFLISFTFVMQPYAFYTLSNITIIGIITAIMNLLPLNIHGITNDGANYLSLKKEPLARRAFAMQLAVTVNLSNGMRLRDIPTDWFELPQNSDLSNTIICGVSVFKCNYLHDQRDFEGAKVLADDLLQNASGLLGLYRNELLCENLFYEMISECRLTEVERLYTKQLKRYILAMKTHVSKVRLLYAYALLVKGDEAKACNWRDVFEKLCNRYPYAGEIESERELIMIIQNIYQKRMKNSVSPCQ